MASSGRNAAERHPGGGLAGRLRRFLCDTAVGRGQTGAARASSAIARSSLFHLRLESRHRETFRRMATNPGPKPREAPDQG